MPSLRLETRAAIRVLLVDDHAVVREGYIRLLELEPDMVVVGECADAETAAGARADARTDASADDWADAGTDTQTTTGTGACADACADADTRPARRVRFDNQEGRSCATSRTAPGSETGRVCRATPRSGARVSRAIPNAFAIDRRG